jgi:hypothetical protein
MVVRSRLEPCSGGMQRIIIDGFGRFGSFRGHGRGYYGRHELHANVLIFSGGPAARHLSRRTKPKWDATEPVSH